MKRFLYLVAALLGAWLVYGRIVHARIPKRFVAAAGESYGAWHVHTDKSDGRGTLDEVARAARQAGLRFVVVTDHNVRALEAPEYRDGVLVIPGTEASTRYGHVVAIDVPRALTPEERGGDPLGAIRALGGEAVIAHPLHPRRAFGGWGTGPWRGLEVVSNDSYWHEVVARVDAARFARAALAAPFEPTEAVLALAHEPSEELARFDAEVRAAGGGGAGKVLLCSADAHGLPSYRAAFEAFSMHVPVALVGDARADARAVTAALLDGRAACVFDGVQSAASVRFGRTPDGGLSLALERYPALGDAPPGAVRVALVRDGVTIGELAPALRVGANALRLDALCGGGGCGPGTYRAEARWRGMPWIFTNPVRIE